MTPRLLPLSLTACAALVTLSGCSSENSQAATSQPVAAFQKDLLELAFTGASKFPRDPHIKNRCRTQQGVVTACLELGLTDRALDYTSKIENWRAGMGYADTAFYCLEHGIEVDVKDLLDKAIRAGESSIEGPQSQTWRAQRVYARVATVYSLMGEHDHGSQMTAGVEGNERSALVIDEARTLDESEFDKAMKIVDQVTDGGVFELVRAQLQKCAKLYERFYDSKEKREQLEKRICEAAPKALPASVRVLLIGEIAKTAGAHGDTAKALELAGRAQGIVDSVPWNPEHRLPLDAAIANALHLGGDTDAAEKQLDAAIAFFTENREATINMYRGRALRPIAETYFAIGKRNKALTLYDTILDEALVNKNSRPRAIDLAETCCSLAVHRIEPTPELRARLQRICEELNHPW